METKDAKADIVVTEQKPDKKRLAVAFAVAEISDLLSFVSFMPPVQWGIDLFTALLLFLLLGRPWAILPGLIAEAIPGLYIFSFWVLVVGSIAVWGAIRQPQRTEPTPSPKRVM